MSIESDLRSALEERAFEVRLRDLESKVEGLAACSMATALILAEMPRPAKTTLPIPAKASIAVLGLLGCVFGWVFEVDDQAVFVGFVMGCLMSLAFDVDRLNKQIARVAS